MQPTLSGAPGLCSPGSHRLKLFCLTCQCGWFWSWFLAGLAVFYSVDAHKHRASEIHSGGFLQTPSSVIFLSDDSTVLGAAVEEKAVGFIQDQLCCHCPSTPDCPLQWLHKMCHPKCGVLLELARSYERSTPGFSRSCCIQEQQKEKIIES